MEPEPEIPAHDAAAPNDAAVRLPTVDERPEVGFRFDEAAREMLASVAQWVGFAGYVCFGTAAIAFGGMFLRGHGIDDGLGPSLVRLITAFVNFLIGMAFVQVRTEFRGAARDPEYGHDYLMAGLLKLHSYYGIHRWIVLAALVVIGIFLGLGLILLLLTFLTGH